MRQRSTRADGRRRVRSAVGWRVMAALAAVTLAAACTGGNEGGATGTPAAPAAAGGFSVRVDGNRLVDGSGAPVRLLGVNRAGTEYMCTGGGGGPFDGPADAASIEAIRSWKANAVRVPLNESCWLGINGLPSAGYDAAAYRQAVVDHVTALNAAGLYVVVDLHWSADGARPAKAADPAPNRDHSPAFWTSVATTFAGSPGVLFDLFNEPFPDSNQSTPAAWTCWRDGGTCPGVPFQVAGMQELLDAVRATGARNVVLLGGVQYANDLSGWLEHRPNDPAGQTAASWHSYNMNICNTEECWSSTVAPVAEQVPVVAGEIGQDNCKHDYVDALMPWLDQRGIGYLGWAWNTYGCGDFPSLISAYDGTPTEYGVGVRDHLRSLAS